MKNIITMLLFHSCVLAQETIPMAEKVDTINKNGEFTNVYKAIEKQNEVNILRLRDNNIDVFIEELYNKRGFKNVEQLFFTFGKDLRYDVIILLPRLKNIVIDYSDCPYLIIDDKIFDSIQKLTVTHCNLMRIPDSLFYRKSINTIELSYNAINFIPNNIPDLNKIKYLSLKHNKISEIPDNFDKLIQLEFLNIGFNLLDSFPKSILKLKNLKALNISSNKIKVIPEEIVKLNKLEILYMNNMEIDKLPHNLSKMKNLKLLVMSGDSLSIGEKNNLIKLLPKNCKIEWTNNDYYNDLELETRKL